MTWHLSFHWFGPPSTSTPDPRIRKMVIKTGVQGRSVAAWAGHQQQHRWVSHGTRYSLISTSRRVDRWAGGALSRSSQVELERDVELERWVETVGISKGQDLCWFSQEYRVGETAQGACMCVCVGVHVFLALWGPKVLKMLERWRTDRDARLHLLEQNFSKWKFWKVYWCKCVHVCVCLVCLGMLPTFLWHTRPDRCSGVCRWEGRGGGVSWQYMDRLFRHTTTNKRLQQTSRHKNLKKKIKSRHSKKSHAQTHPDTHTPRVSGADGITSRNICHPSARRLHVFSWQMKWSVHLCVTSPSFS